MNAKSVWCARSACAAVPTSWVSPDHAPILSVMLIYICFKWLEWSLVGHVGSRHRSSPTYRNHTRSLLDSRAAVAPCHRRLTRDYKFFIKNHIMASWNNDMRDARRFQGKFLEKNMYIRFDQRGNHSSLTKIFLQVSTYCYLIRWNLLSYIFSWSGQLITKWTVTRVLKVL